MRQMVIVAYMVLITALLSIAGLEISVRLLNGVPVFSTTNFVVRDLDRSFNFVVPGSNRTFTFPANTYDPLLGWRLAEGLRAKNPFLTSGEHGVRMNSQEVRSLPRKAILAVGDSFTAGSEVDDQYSWPAQLEAELGIPVNNAGVGAYGVDQIVLRAEALVDVLSPRILVVGTLSQDTLRNTYSVFGGASKPYFRLDNGKAILSGVPVPRSIAGNKEIGLARAIFGHSYLLYSIMVSIGKLPQWVSPRHHYRQEYDSKVGPDISCALMDRLLEMQVSRGIQIIFLMQYGGGEIVAGDRPWFAAPVVQCARDKGLQVIDTFEPLKKIFRSDNMAFKRLYVMHENGTVYGHMSAEGNRLMASMIAEQIRRDNGRAHIRGDIIQ